MSIHVKACTHNGKEEYHLRYPGMSKEAAQEIADRINGGALCKRQMPLTDKEKLDKIEAILFGIDKTENESEAGWWETSTGAHFGETKLNEIRAVFKMEQTS